MITLQEWLDSKHPTKENKEQLKILNYHTFRNEKLEGGSLDLKEYKGLEKIFIEGGSRDLKTPLTELDVSGLSSLNELSLVQNQIKSLNVFGCSNLEIIDLHANLLTSTDFLKQLPNPEKLEKLTLSRNNFQPTTLDVFSRFVNLKFLELGTKKEKIEEGVYNRFYGSLKPLKPLTKLTFILCIAGTDVDSGLEYLSGFDEKGSHGLMLLDCRPFVPEAKVRRIQDQLRPFDYDFIAWQLVHFETMFKNRPELFTKNDNREKWMKKLTNKIKQAQEELNQKKVSGESEERIARLESKLKLLQEAHQKFQQGKWDDLPDKPSPSDQNGKNPCPDDNPSKPQQENNPSGKKENNNNLDKTTVIVIAVSVIITIGIIGYVIFIKKKKKQERLKNCHLF